MKSKKTYFLIFYCFFFELSSAYSCTETIVLRNGKLGYGDDLFYENRAEIYIYDDVYKDDEILAGLPEKINIQVKGVNGQYLTSESIMVKFDTSKNGMKSYPELSIAQIIAKAKSSGGLFNFSEYKESYYAGIGYSVEFSVYTEEKLLAGNHEVTIEFLDSFCSL